MNLNIDFPTRTMEALVQQNKTLSTKLISISKLCDAQEKEIKQLKSQYTISHEESQEKVERYQTLLETYQKIQTLYQELQSSYQKLKVSQKQAKDNLVNTEKQFAIQYTEFLEKQQALRNKNLELVSYISRLTRYKNRVNTRVKPYLQNLKEKIVQSERECLQQREKISTFQKQLKEAYQHIQQISLDIRKKEESFQTKIKHLTERLNQKEVENQHNKKYITDNKYLNERLLEEKNKNSELKAILTSRNQEISHLKEEYCMQIGKLQKQVRALSVEKEDSFHQLRVFSKELIKKEIKQSQVNTLWQRKLTAQVENLQNTLKAEDSKNAKIEKEREFIKNHALSQDKNKLHQIYQTLLEVQTGIFKTVS